MVWHLIKDGNKHTHMMCESTSGISLSHTKLSNGKSVLNSTFTDTDYWNTCCGS